MLAEVESLIEHAVSQVVSQDASLDMFRQDMVDKLVQALETDASWVELYGVTGELIVPGVTLEDDEIGAGLRLVMKVRTSYNSSLPAFILGAGSRREAFANIIWRVEGDCHPCRCSTDART